MGCPWDFGGNAEQTRVWPAWLQFNNPVKIELSYKTADQTGIDEKNLKLFLF